MSVFRILSFLYLLLYIGLFVYIGVEHGIYKALWYVGLIPVIAAAAGGLLILRRTIRRGRARGTLASLTESM
ncbi:hypothetical protein [Paenibacillus hexagrammi]|uniref:Uncharacterized protein n=1 Tax=Paenibacillus hexagrammi TaxID=2908839 RepID=A0ABY3SKN8_9BACL|nr:hypothetical protein [Paenibacillus sp. YPD9-1]UJF33945.1 hypothetical protein L0M14_01455 [Paenibacillus sp. YPD9-1]